MKKPEMPDNTPHHKDWYKEQLERKREIDQSIAILITLITGPITVACFLYKSFTPSEAGIITLILLVFVISSFGSTISLSTIFLIKILANSFQRYKYLPSPVKPEEEELGSGNQFEVFYKKNNQIFWRKIKKEISGMGSKNTLQYQYIELGTYNQNLNEQRTSDKHLAINLFIVSLLLLAIFGFLVIF